VKKVVGMDVSPGGWKEPEFWVVMAKLAGRLAVVAVIALGGSGAVEDFSAVDLERQEAKAATVDNRVVEAGRQTDVAYEEYYELVRYHATQEASCDSALESFSRHRDDERDWRHVLEECHSEGSVADDPRLPAEDPTQ
jgi:hypothetical protein